MSYQIYKKKVVVTKELDSQQQPVRQVFQKIETVQQPIGQQPIGQISNETEGTSNQVDTLETQHEELEFKAPLHDYRPEFKEQQQHFREQFEKQMELHNQRVHQHFGQEEIVEEYGPDDMMLSIIVLGASGDLAKKKIFPSLFGLYALGKLPTNFQIIGYSRSDLTPFDFQKHASSDFDEFFEKKDEFLNKLHYHCGQYDDPADFEKLNDYLKDKEGTLIPNRLFYLSIPPKIYEATSEAMQCAFQVPPPGWSRVIIEKPFGRDTPTAQKLFHKLNLLFKPKELYKIDHFLGKETVQNLVAFRFANGILEPLWNHQHIEHIELSFKEEIGIEGRADFFEENGIIRDVMQNHLLQIMALITMELPASTKADDVTNEKIKVLRSFSPLTRDLFVCGQYVGDGQHKGYKEEEGISKASKVPTYASAIFHLNTPRWKGVPVVIKCGKALNEKKSQVVIQFRHSSKLFEDLPKNQLIISFEPEGFQLEMNQKAPGSTGFTRSELKYLYETETDIRIPQAHEVLIEAALAGDQSLFLRQDEIIASWNIFNPILYEMDQGKITPQPYTFGSVGPIEGDEILKKVTTLAYHPTFTTPPMIKN
mgnify:CR=1 FL=1